MDKHRAQVEIESLFWSKKEKTAKEVKTRLGEILEELQTYNYDWGRRQGMFRAVNALTELAEKESKK